MALIWIESFDLYGTDLTFLTQRGYIQQQGALSNNSAFARTGTGCFFWGAGPNEPWVIRPCDALNVCTQGVAFYFDGAYTGPDFFGDNPPGFYFRQFGNRMALRIVANNEFGFSVYQWGTFRGKTPSNVYAPNTWGHVEAQVIAGTGTGSVAIRINGVLVATIIGLSIAPIDGFGLGREFNGQLGGRFDDWTVTDDSGDYNTGFLGDRRCVTSFPNADTLLNDWTPSVGTEGFQMLNNAPPNNAEFVQANAPGDIAEYEKTEVGITTNDIAGIVIIGRAAKTDAGGTTFRLGINSNGVVDNGPAEAPNVAPSYSFFQHYVERNPEGNIPWTRTAVDNSLIRITRED